LISNFFDGALTLEWLIICIGIFVACGAVMWLFYYRRRKKTTELWLPRAITRFIQRKARNTDDGIEAFSLGLLSNFAEMPLCLAIFFVAANSILHLSSGLQIVAVIAYTLATALPMVILKIRVKTGKSAVEAQKWRIRNKGFAKFFSGSSFMLLAIFIVAFWVI
jgi:hypothetical protein